MKVLMGAKNLSALFRCPESTIIDNCDPNLFVFLWLRRKWGRGGAHLAEGTARAGFRMGLEFDRRPEFIDRPSTHHCARERGYFLQKREKLTAHCKKKRRRSFPLRRLFIDGSLEIVAQAELHAARLREQGAGDAQIAAGKPRANRGRIEADGIGYVIGLPTKLQRTEFP